VIDFLLLQAITLQVINVNGTTPCFLNYSAGAEMWRNCGITDDFLTTAMMPWQYITGGYFSMFLVGIFTLASYIKYHKVVYPLMIGVLFLPISYFLFPNEFLTFAIIMAFLGVGAVIYKALTSQTKEYSG